MLEGKKTSSEGESQEEYHLSQDEEQTQRNYDFRNSREMTVKGNSTGKRTQTAR